MVKRFGSLPWEGRPRHGTKEKETDRDRKQVKRASEENLYACDHPCLRDSVVSLFTPRTMKSVLPSPEVPTFVPCTLGSLGSQKGALPSQVHLLTVS